MIALLYEQKYSKKREGLKKLNHYYTALKITCNNEVEPLTATLLHFIVNYTETVEHTSFELV